MRKSLCNSYMQNHILFSKKQAFSLLELLTALLILGILSSISYPSYLKHLQKSRRAQAKIILIKWANEIHEAKLQNPFNPITLNKLLPSTRLIKDYYQMQALQQTPFTLSAIPIGTQSMDSCGILLLQENGEKISAQPANNCW